MSNEYYYLPARDDGNPNRVGFIRHKVADLKPHQKKYMEAVDRLKQSIGAGFNKSPELLAVHNEYMSKEYPQ